MSEVWVLTYDIEYEGSYLQGVFSTIAGIQEWIVKKQPRYKYEEAEDQTTVCFYEADNKNRRFDCFTAKLTTVDALCSL